MGLEFYASLPVTFAILLLELIAGTGLAMLFVEYRLEVGRGFLQFMAASASAVLFIVVSVTEGEIRPLAIAATIAALVVLLAAVRDAPVLRRAATALYSLLAGGAALGGLAALTGAVTPVGVVSMFGASVSLGASMTGMLLGHWYLVSPMLSSDPLLRLTGMLIGGLTLQIALIGWFGAAGPAPESLPLVLWMRVAFGLVLPGAMVGFVWYACRTRAMRTATGILYLAAGSILMGDVTAKAYLVLTKVPI